MYLDNNNHFYGKIGGKSINDFLKFDYNLKSCQERIDFVNEVLEMYKVDGVEFYDEYFDEVYDQDRKFGKIDIVIGKDKSQYTESNIASALEIMTNYILAVDEKDENINYKIYTSEELFNRACQEFNVINGVAKANGGLSMRYDSNEVSEPFPIFQLPKNYKKVKDLKFEKDDLQEYPYMKDYYDFYEYLKDESKRLWGKKKLTRKESIKRGKIKKLLPEVKKDMMEVKKQMQMPIIWKSPLKDNGKVDYEELDMFDKNVIKELLRVHKQIDLQDDLSCILVDLENLIKKVDFSDKQLKVLDLWRNGLEIDKISKILKVRQNTISKTLDRAIESIIKQYEEEYENWYQFDKNGKRGLYPRCKKCRKS